MIAAAVLAAALSAAAERPFADLALQVGGSHLSGARFRLDCSEGAGGTRCDDGVDGSAQLGLQVSPSLDLVGSYRRVRLEGIGHVLDAPALGFAWWGAGPGSWRARLPVLVGPVFAYGKSGVMADASAEAVWFPTGALGAGAGFGGGAGAFDGRFALLLRVYVTIHVRPW